MYSFDSFADGNHLFVWCVENFCGDKKPFPLHPQAPTMFIGLSGDGNMLDTN